MKSSSILCATLASVIAVSTLSGCVPEVKLDCEASVPRTTIDATSELSIVIAPTDNFVSFSDAFEASRSRLSKLIANDGTVVTTVLADGEPRQFSQTLTDYSGTDTESDRQDVMDASLSSVRRLFRCATEDVTGTFAVQDGSDILAALRTASASFDESVPSHRIVVIGNGLQIGGQLPLNELGLPTGVAEAKSLVSQLKSDGALPNLKGSTVDFIGIGMTDGEKQSTLNQQSRDVLEALWQLIIVESNGIPGEFVPEIPAGAPSQNAIKTESVKAVDNACLFSLGVESGYEFTPDTDTFLDSAKASAAAGRIVDELNSAGCDGTLIVTGYTASGASKSEFEKNKAKSQTLSLRRAEAFKQLLVAAGLKNDVIVVGGGKGPFEDWNPDGSFNEKVGRKNRIVEIVQK